VPRIAVLLAAWRERHGSVVFTRHCHTGEDDLGMLGRFFSDFIRCGEPDAEILPALAPLDDEPVVGKTTYDAFWGTDLEDILRARHVEQILLTGVLTHMCCETTARAAFCRGFEVYIPVDATASSDEMFHVASLCGLADSVAVVMATREVLERCERHA
jgi:bifunctional isochorismate lyase/aryl carrier protein